MDDFGSKRVRSRPSDESLSSEEGFLWSRITHEMYIKDLLPLLPWPHSESLELLDGLQKKHAVELVEPSPPSTPSPNQKNTKTLEIPDEVRRKLDTDRLDILTRDLDEAFRVDILLRLHGIEEKNPYDVLGVRRSSTTHEIKKRYLSLSRQFHPDRFFRRNLGHYKKKLDLLFSYIQEAYNKVKNPHDREALNRRLKLKDSEKDRSGAAPAAKKVFSEKKIDPRLRKIGEADKHYRAGLVHKKKGEYEDAVRAFQLANQINPRKEYENAIEDTRPYAQKGRAQQFIVRAKNAFEFGLYNDALAEAEAAINANPDDGDANLWAAKAIAQLGDYEKMPDAIEYLKRSKVCLPTNTEPCILLGKIYAGLGEKKKARVEYELALKRNPRDAVANKLLSKILSK